MASLVDTSSGTTTTTTPATTPLEAASPLSYAKWDAWKKATEADERRRPCSDWEQSPGPGYVGPEERALIDRTPYLAAAPPLLHPVELDDLRSARQYNGKRGVVVSRRICAGERVAVELLAEDHGATTTASRAPRKILQVRPSNLTMDLVGGAVAWPAVLADRASHVGDGVYLGDCLAAALVADVAGFRDALRRRTTSGGQTAWDAVSTQSAAAAPPGDDRRGAPHASFAWLRDLGGLFTLQDDASSASHGSSSSSSHYCGTVVCCADELCASSPPTAQEECASSDANDTPPRVHVIALPARDALDERIDRFFEPACAALDAATAAARAVLVHCVQGKSRSAAILVAWLAKTHGLREAWRRVTTARPAARPNAAFVVALLKWQQGLPQGRDDLGALARELGMPRKAAEALCAHSKVDAETKAFITDVLLPQL